MNKVQPLGNLKNIYLKEKIKLRTSNIIEMFLSFIWCFINFKV